MHPSIGPVGRRSVVIEGREVDLLAPSGNVPPPIERTIEMRCLSGASIAGTWRGPPLLDLVSAVGAPGRATHLVAEAGDGHLVPLALADLTGGLLAGERVDGPGGSTDGPGPRLPRVVAPGLDGPHAVKNVVRIDLASLPPGTDPGALGGVESGLPPRVVADAEGVDE